MVQVDPDARTHRLYTKNKVHGTMFSWIPPKVTMLHRSQTKRKILKRKVYFEEQVS